MKLFNTKPARRLFVSSLFALLVSSCSGSDGSSSDNPAVLATTDAANDLLLDTTDATGLATIEPNESQESETQDTAEVLLEATSDETIDDGSAGDTSDGTMTENSSTTDSESENTNVITQSFTQVNFEIMVPAYQSNALQVRLVWGEITMSASWIGDELWMATTDFPTDTEQLLTITFYDNNGSIVLGSYERMYRTGSNAAEIYTVSADQLDKERWDTDGDGTSNFDELVAQTDPLVDEDSLLTIVDSANFYFGTYAARLEESISDERPYSGNYFAIDVDVDIDGNGSSYYFDNSDYYNQVERRATRTNTGNSILWDGKTSNFDGDYTFLNTFTAEVSIVDQNTRLYVEEDYVSYYGTYTDSSTESSNIIGVLVEGTPYCKPISGTATTTTFSNRSSTGSPDTTSITISKEIGDLYWRVKTVAADKQETEYLARELNVISGDTQEVALFKCDFVDF